LIVAQPMIVTSDVLLRKTLGYYGIRNEDEITEIKKAGMMMMAIQQAQAQQAAGAKGQPGQTGSGPTPTNSGIQDQLMAQMGGLQ
jgi:hypothetical protein